MRQKKLKQYDKTTLASVVKEMAQPRFAKSTKRSKKGLTTLVKMSPKLSFLKNTQPVVLLTR
jgi:hypothetical protein